MSSNCPATSAKRDDASTNVTELIHGRLQSSPKEDWDRLLKCWGYDDCGDCHRSEGHCGWCAIVRTHFVHLPFSHEVVAGCEQNRSHSCRRIILPYPMVHSVENFTCLECCETLLNSGNSRQHAFRCPQIPCQKRSLSSHPSATTRYVLYVPSVSSSALLD